MGKIFILVSFFVTTFAGQSSGAVRHIDSSIKVERGSVTHSQRQVAAKPKKVSAPKVKAPKAKAPKAKTPKAPASQPTSPKQNETPKAPSSPAPQNSNEPYSKPEDFLGKVLEDDPKKIQSVLNAIDKLSNEYDVPKWFLKAIVHRESSFMPDHINHGDGIGGNENWNHRRTDDCAITNDGYPHGLGLTQITGWMYQGMPYPLCLDQPDNDNRDYYYAMAKQNFGEWVKMENVSRLTNPLDPEQNLRRFLTAYAVPAYRLFSSQHKGESEEQIWRRVAFHWNKGMYMNYDPNNTDYLGQYDEYVRRYK
ncbi:hypothetical protein COV82_06485 [Candidatus Peregrinibacteria bacterium CG11_big_fil_rev_8_21_14_0_20_46_8]|nr:MAG: hypothetical protein COV82_06485 [Candidatus Peregrinibacteria bacterium CG11_big_fil_rev_8_21_14_0_20_46_8]